MSQKKVDAYKEEKRNRKTLQKKARLKERLHSAIWILVGLLLLLWIGYSIYNNFTSNKEVTKKTYEINTTAIDNYYENIESSTHEEEETESLTEAEAIELDTEDEEESVKEETLLEENESEAE